MKKGEAIEIIAKRLGPIGISYPVCEEILDALLNAGMLPPFSKPKFDRSLGECTHDLKNYKWDEE